MIKYYKKPDKYHKKVSLNLPFSTFPAFCDKQVLKFQKSFKCAGLPARNMAKACKKNWKTGALGNSVELCTVYKEELCTKRKKSNC